MWGQQHFVLQIRATLEGRLAKAALGDLSKCVAVVQVLPRRGCVITTHIVPCRRDSLEGVNIFSYIDNICLLAVGKFLNTVLELIQRDLHTAEVWCKDDNLLANSDKTALSSLHGKGTHRLP